MIYRVHPPLCLERHTALDRHICWPATALLARFQWYRVGRNAVARIHDEGLLIGIQIEVDASVVRREGEDGKSRGEG